MVGRKFEATRHETIGQGFREAQVDISNGPRSPKTRCSAPDKNVHSIGRMQSNELKLAPLQIVHVLFALKATVGDQNLIRS